MTELHSNTKKKSYTHLTDMERGQIAAYHQEGFSSSEIGKRMGRNKSTISREIKRGTVEQLDTFRRTYMKYFPDVAARKYEENRLNCGARFTLMKA